MYQNTAGSNNDPVHNSTKTMITQQSNENTTETTMVHK